MSEIVDEFYTARNLLYLGAYPQALAALPMHLSAPQELEKQALQYRAFLGQGNSALVLAEIPSKAPVLLEAVRALAESHSNPQTSLSTIRPLIAEASNLQSPAFVAIAAQILAANGSHDDALRILALHPKNLECAVMTINIYLAINRADLAQKLVARMRSWSEDAPLAQLAEAWTALFTGGPKYNDAFYIFEELAQASSVSTARLLNARAVAKLHLAQYPEAMDLLQQALEKDSNDPDTLANLIVCANLTGKPLETKSRYLSQLRHVAPAHPFISDFDAKDAEFDALAAKYSK
ncbi:hypothetical protein GGI25_004354 [Coemansia spiralis]|uniref:Coatomer subunit epsilon n=2 Tax=Coemansia TaxID=4863 RepID=A0A9W8G6T5_9FUNG|nr:epsilon subunit of coatomer protein complex-like protein [Coemansia spiralis]KAJ1992058.1 hypothetical protein EDC05_003049 [Coemansia umbellata]KAJ2621439.1 hypothetical protein GGI26_004121 [Coemansia sp. RSA 1358]KAJ2674414.1 hypothetical protein GGI25_004354 [Coemansia spiralis]